MILPNFFFKSKFLPIYLFIILYPYYIFPSGTPQPAHIVLIMGIIFFLFKRHFKMDKTKKSVSVIFLFFILYTVVINTISVQYSSSFLPIVYSFYYIFGFLVLIYTFNVNNKTLFAKGLIYSIIFSMLIELFLIIFLGIGKWGDTRFHGTFNNPNQLGYFSVLASSIAIISSFYLKKTLKYPAIILTLSTLLALFSGSRTAMAAIGYLYIAVMFYYKSFKKTFLFLSFLSILIAFAFLLSNDNNTSIINNFINRVEAKTTAQNDIIADLKHRGWDRIPRYGLYIFTGMGEGIQYLGYDIEAHNNFLAILYGYGIIGISLLIVLLFYLFIYNDKFFLLGIIPSFIYGMGHNGMRATLLYLLIALIIIFKEKNQNG